MKTLNFRNPCLAIVALTALTLIATNVVAQDSTTAAPRTTQPAAASQPAPQLSYGVADILKMEQAKVGDSVIINYIQNSGNNYGLNASQIIYLRQQGVSEGVINAMLNQRSQTAQASPAPAQDAAVNASSTAATHPTVTYVQPSSSVYVIPNTQANNYNNWFYYQAPYYGYYPYGYCWPYSAVTFSFGWGGYYRGGWYGGYHYGGWHAGGGWHHR